MNWPALPEINLPTSVALDRGCTRIELQSLVQGILHRLFRGRDGFDESAIELLLDRIDRNTFR